MDIELLHYMVTRIGSQSICQLLLQFYFILPSGDNSSMNRENGYRAQNL